MATPELTRLHQAYEDITYDKKFGPNVPDSIAEKEGKANCQRFVRDAIETHFGILIPNTFLSQEIYSCQQNLFKPISFGDEEFGDIFMLGPDTQTVDPRSLHLTFFEGEYHDIHDPYLHHFHGNGKNKGLKKYAMSTFRDSEHVADYGKIWGVRRLSPDGILTINLDILPSPEEVNEYFKHPIPE